MNPIPCLMHGSHFNKRIGSENILADRNKKRSSEKAPLEDSLLAGPSRAA